MKKLILVIVIIFAFYSSIFAQLSGSGTSSDPYMGTITGPVTWNTGTTVYATDLTILSGGTLAISPGAIRGTWLIGISLTVNAGGTFIINPRASASIEILENNGTVRLESFPNEAGVASLIHEEQSGEGIYQIRLYLSGGTSTDGSYIWHYVSLPISGVFATNFNSLDLAQYVEALSTTSDNSQGWVAYDGYQYSTETMLPIYSFSSLSIGKGYNYYSSQGSTLNFESSIININTVSQNLLCSGLTEYQGFNLIGNPFSSSIDWDYLVRQGAVTNANDAIYFTNRGTYPSYVNGIGTDGATQFIPPLQGFFVKANNLTGGRVRFLSGSRSHDFDQMRYKKGSDEIGKSSDTISFVRLKFENISDSCDAVVRFNNKANLTFDKSFDALKFSKTAGEISIWTTTNNSDYSINGLPFPDSKIDLPVGINVVKAGSFKLSSSEINKLENYSVVLKDLSTNTSIDLRKGEEMTFDAPSGITENRFILSIANLTTDIPVITTTERKFSIYASYGNLNILSLSDEYGNFTGSVTVYDLTGRKILQVNNLEWNGNGDLKQFAVDPAEKGLFIVEVKAGNKKYVEKVNLNR